VEHPIRANARGAALLASLALGETTVGDLSRAVRITAKFSPNPAHRARYDAMYSEFKALYKANKAIHRRLSRS
jgi:xylulokinase